jgi:hypothetical protein
MLQTAAGFRQKVLQSMFQPKLELFLAKEVFLHSLGHWRHLEPTAEAQVLHVQVQQGTLEKRASEELGQDPSLREPQKLPTELGFLSDQRQ